MTKESGKEDRRRHVGKSTGTHTIGAIDFLGLAELESSATILTGVFTDGLTTLQLVLAADILVEANVVVILFLQARDDLVDMVEVGRRVRSLANDLMLHVGEGNGTDRLIRLRNALGSDLRDGREKCSGDGELHGDGNLVVVGEKLWL